MAKEKTYIFETSGGFSIDGKGTTPRKGYCSAKKELNKMKPEMRKSVGKLTGRYNTYGRDDLVETGSFPKNIKNPETC